MKTLLFLTGCFIGIVLTGYFQQPCEDTFQLSKEAKLTLETVANDTFLQRYVLSPTERERTKRAQEEFDKKYPKK